jgi:RimJ/RimL family protein N-acetyltransferase
VLAPVGWRDCEALRALKADPGSFALMLGGVRATAQADAELAEDMRSWAARGVGMWAVRAPGDERLLGITGVHDRPDGLGTALRFAFWPDVRGKGLAREAAGAALRFAHDRAGLARVVAVARESNRASRLVLGAIGMREYGAFERGGERVLIYESGTRLPPPPVA